ncbi:hypothetical protein BDF20DRAFT_869659, partial [Mycotypha africana]|uniref:uncharacterized protein n=1 Tax=Mycotypha africana TaxID=64632 RepID=UPI002301A20D
MGWRLQMILCLSFPLPSIYCSYAVIIALNFTRTRFTGHGSGLLCSFTAFV